MSDRAPSVFEIADYDAGDVPALTGELEFPDSSGLSVVLRALSPSADDHEGGSRHAD